MQIVGLCRSVWMALCLSVCFSRCCFLLLFCCCCVLGRPRTGNVAYIISAFALEPAERSPATRCASGSPVGSFPCFDRYKSTRQCECSHPNSTLAVTMSMSPRVRQAAAHASRRKGWAQDDKPVVPVRRSSLGKKSSAGAGAETKSGGVVTQASARVARRLSHERRRSSEGGPRWAMSAAAAAKQRKPLKRQFYTVHFRKADFEIDVRYQNCKYMRSGAYGRVCSAIDSLDGQKVAIKKVPEMFEDLVDAKRILREIKLLLHFKNNGGHQNIVMLRDIMCGSRSSRSFEDCYIVLDAYE